MLSPSHSQHWFENIEVTIQIYVVWQKCWL